MFQTYPDFWLLVSMGKMGDLAPLLLTVPRDADGGIKASFLYYDSLYLFLFNLSIFRFGFRIQIIDFFSPSICFSTEGEVLRAVLCFPDSLQSIPRARQTCTLISLTLLGVKPNFS